MFNLQSISLRLKENLPLAIILVFAAIVRFVGLDYGLPLWLVGDEVAHIFGALKMIELKTVLPVLHSAEFGNVFYYTPYLSYLYLLPFSAAAGIKFLFFSGAFEQFKNYLIADPSVFFATARAISAIFGLATVYFVYAAAWQIFRKKKIALFSALFLAFSFLHVSYSHWARHWTVVTFFYALGLYILAHRSLTISRRYLLVALLMGIGVGVNVQMTIFGVFVLLWFFLFDYQPIGKLLRQKWFWQACAAFLLLFGIAFVLWPRGYGFFLLLGNAGSAGAISGSGLGGLLGAFQFYLSAFILSEPVFLLFIITGLAAMLYLERRRALIFVGFPLIYLAIFYTFFTFIDRYILPIYPWLAIVAGYGLFYVSEKLKLKALNLVLIIVVCAALIVPVLRFDYLLYKNDTRVQATEWVSANIPPEEKIIVLVPLMRLSAAPSALNEQESIDPSSLRNVDRAEMIYGSQPGKERGHHVLNLYNIKNDEFFENLGDYIRKNGYNYIVYNPAFAKEKGVDILNKLFGKDQHIFRGTWDSLSSAIHQPMPDGFGQGIKELFYSPSLGPEIRVIKIN